MSGYRQKLLLWSAVVTLMSCQPQTSNQVTEFKVPVTVTRVGLSSIESVIRTSGTLRVPELVSLPVRNSGNLLIARRNTGKLVEGDLVESGELIATITGEDARLATRLLLEKQSYEESQIKLKASEELFAKNIISSTTLEEVKTEFERAKLGYETSLYDEERNHIRSPIDGTILELARSSGQLMADGQIVNAGQTIAVVGSLDKLIADITLVGSDIALVRSGLNARIRYFAWQEQQFSGEVLRLAPTIDETTRSLTAEVQVDNSKLSLKPGMFVEVTLLIENKQDVPVIPRRALTRRGGKQVIFVLNGQRVEQREVKLGLRDESNVEILEGVDVNERVVILGLETLTDQMPVRIQGE